MIFVKEYFPNPAVEGEVTRLEFWINDPTESIELIEVESEAAAGFIDITEQINDRGLYFLDVLYAATGSKAVTFRYTVAAVPTSLSYSLDVTPLSDDPQFSNDSDLIEIEDSILGYLRKGRSSFRDKHRAARKLILDTLHAQRITTSQGGRLEFENIAEIEDVKAWSKYLALYFIFSSLQTEPDDFFATKAAFYKSLADQFAADAAIKIGEDFDNSGTIEDDEKRNRDLVTTRLVRR